MGAGAGMGSGAAGWGGTTGAAAELPLPAWPEAVRAARSAAAFPAPNPGRPDDAEPEEAAPEPWRGPTARKVMVPSSAIALSEATAGAGAAGAAEDSETPVEPLSALGGLAVGGRNTNVLPAGAAPASAPPVPVPVDSPPAGPDACATLGSAPQETRRSWSPPKPDWWERSAPHAEAGSGRLPCCESAGEGDGEKGEDGDGYWYWDWEGEGDGDGDGDGEEDEGDGRAPSTGSSSKKYGPVSSTVGTAGAEPEEPEPEDAVPKDAAPADADGASGAPPSSGAGRLVPGTQAAPFQYRTYPGMDGSG
ncbi:hypothetical protein GCM10027073_21150 [Streptomyces chlorus]